MAGWLKQGLSTLGEGISTLTKEILAEEPPDHHAHLMADTLPAALSDHSSHNGFESLGTRAEIDRLRALVAELEERANRADIATNAQFQQMVREYEHITVAQRARIAELESQIQDQYGNGYSVSTESRNTAAEDSEGFREINLFAESPDLKDPMVLPVVPASPPRSLLHKDSIDSGLVEALEHEITEKNSTIRHLTQEISRSKVIISELESAMISVQKLEAEIQTIDYHDAVPQLSLSVCLDQSSQTDENSETELPVAPRACDAEIQTTDVESKHSSTSASSDDFIHPADEYKNAVETVDSETQTVVEVSELLKERTLSPEDHLLPSKNFSFPDGEFSVRTDASTMCRLHVPISDQDTQSEDIPAILPKITETAVAQVQTEIGAGDRIFAGTADCGVQFDDHRLATSSQTDFVFPAIDKSFQHDTVIASADQSVQHFLIHPECATQTDEVETLQALIGLTDEAMVQTEDVSVESHDCQTTVNTFDNECQSDISGDIALFQDYARIVEETQAMHTQLGNLTSGHDRSRREVERLKAHLVTVEQGFAMDFQLAQQREEDLKELVQQLESQVAFESASDRSASQEAEMQLANLLEEVRVLTEARDIVVAKLHVAEKKNNQLEGSLSKLRMAIDHLKLEQRTEIEHEKEKSKKAYRGMEDHLESLTASNTALEAKYATASSDLLASVRAVAEADNLRLRYDALAAQFEEQTSTLNRIQDESASVNKARVDTDLMKNMLMGYLLGPKNVQTDILRMMMSTLNFSEAERQKIKNNQTSTLLSLFSSPSGKVTHEPDNSFSNLLVKFIEQESKPKSISNGIPAEMPIDPPKPAVRPYTVPAASVRALSSQRIYSASTGRSNAATDPSMAQDRMLEDILNGPDESTTSRPGSVDTV